MKKNALLFKQSHAMADAHKDPRYPLMDETLEKLFTSQLQHSYYAEKQIPRLLPKMIKAATSEELQEALEEQLGASQEQLLRLEEVFQLINRKPEEITIDTVDDLHKEADRLLEATKGSVALEISIIMAAQKMIHYKMANYACLAQLAEAFGMKEVAALLHHNLDDERTADKQLVYITEHNINYNPTPVAKSGPLTNEEDE